ncbi:MAG: NAD(P)H-binding protein [Fibrobacteraceae bacterium]|nr:NAD(P)H-binding protein [Fibrobacteraceae bacterium]
MRALITGGAGVVGRALVEELLLRQVEVRVLTLPGDALAKTLLPSEVEIFYGDVTDYNSIRPAFDNIDVVYHLAAILLSTKDGEFDRINLGGTMNVVSAIQDAGIHRLLYVSSISVTYPVLTPYGKSKLAGEKVVKNSELDWTIVRPTLVVGHGGGVEYNMYARYVSRFPFYFLPGGGKSRKIPVCSGDLVKGIAAAGLEERAIGKTYALAGSRELSMAEMAQCILRQNKKRGLMIPMPWWVCKKLALLKNFIGGKRVSAEQALAGFLYDAVPSVEDAKKDLNYHPKSPF